MILNKMIQLIFQQCWYFTRYTGCLLAMVMSIGLIGCHSGQVTLHIEGAEHGSVTINPGSEDKTYPRGSYVQVSFTADDGYVFVGWSGGSDSTDSAITVLMDKNKTLTAHVQPAVTIELREASHGSYTVDPPVISGTQVPFDTEFTITAIPDAGYKTDSIYKMMYASGSDGWSVYLDESEVSPHRIQLDEQDVRYKVYGSGLNTYVLGAFFIPEDTWGDLDEQQDIVYASPGSKTLKYDVYSPVGAKDLPIVIIIHGGAWFVNDESLMRGVARYIAQTGRYVAVSVDYRLLSDPDDPAPVKADSISDIYGAIAHIQEHAGLYGGDARRLLITGDSSGGHLAESAVLLTPYIGNGGYTGEVGTSCFLPDYIPSGMDVNQVRDSIQSSIIGASLSYGAFKSDAFQHPDGIGHMDAAVEPMSNIPQSGVRVLPPQFFQVGSNDMSVGTDQVIEFHDALKAAGQTASIEIFEGIGHAYLDWKPEDDVIETFNTTGKKALDSMLTFFDSVVANGSGDSQ